jgi:hypothetical protein
MATDRRQQILLGALLIVLAVVAYRTLNGTSPSSPASSNPAKAGGSNARGGERAPEAPDVHLDALNAVRPKPVGAERNLFRFRQRTASPEGAMTRGSGAAPVAAPVAPVPTGPPPPPPISLKFIGTIRAEGLPIAAILSDGQGPPMRGVEGQTIAGRYRILRIGVESIELSYLDGRGRQSIRLTGGQ